MKPVHWALVTALTALSVGAVAATLGASRETAPSIVHARSLDWRNVTLAGRNLRPLRLPAAVLYVLPSCEHCRPAIKRFAAETRGRALTSLVIAGSDVRDVRDYEERLGLAESIAIDSARSFARSAKLEWVPSLILLSADSTAWIAPVPAPALVTHYLKRLH